MNDTTVVTPDLDRLAERIEKAAVVLQNLRAERERLTHERDELAARVQDIEEKLQGQDPAALVNEVQSLRREQRDWQTERREVAVRIEALVKKLERIEA